MIRHLLRQDLAQYLHCCRFVYWHEQSKSSAEGRQGAPWLGGKDFTDPAGSYIAARRNAISVRWAVVLVCSYLLFFFPKEWAPSIAIQGFIILYLLSNAGLYFTPERLFLSSRFQIPLVSFDLLCLTATLLLTGNTETDFYLVYFLVMIVSALSRDIPSLALLAVLAPSLYGYILLKGPPSHDPSVFLRLPFLFIVALFCGYFTRLTRAQRASMERAAERARNAMRLAEAKSEALGFMSHELRTHLHSIQGFSEVLADRMLGDIKKEQERALTAILKGCDNLVEVVNNFLEAARIEAGAVKVHARAIDLADLMDKVRSAYDPSLHKAVKLTWDYPAEPVMIKTDGAKLRFILQNLISNAVKFTEKGEVSVSARYRPDTGLAEFKVSDTGIGISREELPVIFEKFRQSNSSSSRPSGGVGLGLHIVKTFTGVLGGSVTVSSEVGKGTTFTVTIPCERKHLERASKHSRDASRSALQLNPARS